MLRRSLSNITGMIERTPRHDTRRGTARHGTMKHPSTQRLKDSHFSTILTSLRQSCCHHTRYAPWP